MWEAKIIFLELSKHVRCNFASKVPPPFFFDIKHPFPLHFRNIHYIDYEGIENYFTLKNFPNYLEKKVKLLNYFMNYMKEHLLKAGANIHIKEGDELSRIPSLKTWFRTSRAVVMHLTNGTLQANFCFTIISQDYF